MKVKSSSIALCKFLL